MFLKSFFTVMIVVLSFTLQNSKVNAQSCPSGMSFQVERMIIDGCEYDVELCYTCGFTHPGDVQVMGITRVDPNCPTTLNFVEVITSVYAHVHTSTFIYNNLCQDPQPCPDGDLMTVNRWACWRLRMINYLGEETIKHEPCSYDAYCEETFSYCWDEDEQRVIRTFVESNYVGTPGCLTEPRQITIPTEVGGKSDCFIYQSSCED